MIDLNHFPNSDFRDEVINLMGELVIIVDKYVFYQIPCSNQINLSIIAYLD